MVERNHKITRNEFILIIIGLTLSLFLPVLDTTVVVVGKLVLSF